MLVALVAGLGGLLIGSFLTVVVDRVPRRASIVAPGSACGRCGLELGPFDLVPVLSWLALRGRCRRCRAPIGVEPLVLEVATATLFVLFAFRFDGLWEVIAFCVLGAGLIALSWIDLRTKRLPRQITYFTALLGAPLLIVAALVRDEPHRIATMFGGAAIALAVMGLLYVVSRGGMGNGDVRLSPLLGGFLGWLGLAFVPLGLFLAFLFGAVIGLVAMVIGRAGRKTALPFGPFLALGTLVAVFAGRALIDRYWST